ncbi:MAG: hypothetical protein IKP00_14785 [Victivallales bacterium]|nr:hypothetical protein [Victivallales bacterium]
MTERISDSTLGSRFWSVSDFSLPPIDAALRGEVGQPLLNDVKHDSSITTFVNAGGDTMAQNAINKAELFAASHTLNEEDVQRENKMADRNLLTLIGDENAVNHLIETAAEKFVEKHSDVEMDDAKAFCRTSLRKLMATRELDERANIDLPPLPNPLPNDENAGTRRLGANGLAALKNAVVGLASMLKDGKISEKAVLILANSNFYDASSRSDMLRLAADSAKKVKELFIGEARFNALIQQCKDRLTAKADTLSPARKEQLEARMSDLEHLRDLAIAERKKATACIKTDFQFTDATGKVKSDNKYQKQQLDQIRDSLRAFRYDIDLLRSTDMKTMEKMRRFFDNARSSVDQSKRLTAEQFDTIRAKDNDFNNCLAELRDVLFDAVPAQEARQAEMDDYEKVSANVGRSDMIDLDDSCVAATKFSHLTNDRIRYHYSGVETRESVHFKAIHNELGEIAENGGSRSVTFKAGLDAFYGLGLFGAEAKVKAGFTGDVTAQINVSNANGTVSVTYSVGGGVQASVKGNLGVDPNSSVPQAGLGVSLEAKGSLGGTYSTTKTYANLEEFAKTVSKLNMVLTPRPREVFYSYSKAAIKGIGHVFMLGATLAGFRISRSKMDQVAYSASLRNRNVFGDMGGVFLKKRNVEVLGERKAISVKGGLQFKGDGGLYFKTGDGSLGSNLAFGAGISGDYSRELYASGKSYKSFAKSLMVCSALYLQNSFEAEAAEMKGAWKDELVAIVNDGAKNNVQGIAQSLSKLSVKLTELEESAIGKDGKDKEFWNDFAAKARLLAVATALLTKRADALDAGADGASEAKTAAKAAGEYIIPRLANPVVEIPPKVFQESFFDVFNVTTPRTSRIVGTFNVHVDLLGNLFDEVKDTFRVGEDDRGTFVGAIGNPTANAAVGIIKDTSGLSSKLEVRVTRENVVSKHKDARPWLNNGKTTLDVRVSANLPVRFIFDLVARYYVKHAGGLDEADEAKWKKEFIDSLIDSVKLSAEDVAIDSAVPLMELTLGDAAKKFPALGKLLGGADFLKKKYDSNYAFNDGVFKTLRFEFGPGGRFSGFTLAEDYDTEAKLEFTPGSYASINFSLSSKTSTNDWSVIPKPTVNSIMKRAADYASAGNPQGFLNFLERNKRGVLRLVEAGRLDAVPPPKDKYWQKDADSIKTTIEKCTQLLVEMAGKGGSTAEQAHGLLQPFLNAADAMQHHNEDIRPADAINLAARFFDLAAKIYTLEAMTA